MAKFSKQKQFQNAIIRKKNNSNKRNKSFDHLNIQKLKKAKTASRTEAILGELDELVDNKKNYTDDNYEVEETKNNKPIEAPSDILYKKSEAPQKQLKTPSNSKEDAPLESKDGEIPISISPKRQLTDDDLIFPPEPKEWEADYVGVNCAELFALPAKQLASRLEVNLGEDGKPRNNIEVQTPQKSHPKKDREIAALVSDFAERARNLPHKGERFLLKKKMDLADYEEFKKIFFNSENSVNLAKFEDLDGRMEEIAIFGILKILTVLKRRNKNKRKREIKLLLKNLLLLHEEVFPNGQRVLGAIGSITAQIGSSYGKEFAEVAGQFVMKMKQFVNAKSGSVDGRAFLNQNAVLSLFAKIFKSNKILMELSAVSSSMRRRLGAVDTSTKLVLAISSASLISSAECFGLKDIFGFLNGFFAAKSSFLAKFWEMLYSENLEKAKPSKAEENINYLLNLAESFDFLAQDRKPERSKFAWIAMTLIAKLLDRIKPICGRYVSSSPIQKTLKRAEQNAAKIKTPSIKNGLNSMISSLQTTSAGENPQTPKNANGPTNRRMPTTIAKLTPCLLSSKKSAGHRTKLSLQRCLRRNEKGALRTMREDAALLHNKRRKTEEARNERKRKRNAEVEKMLSEENRVSVNDLLRSKPIK